MSGIQPSMTGTTDLRTQVVTACRRMVAAGLVHGTSGNISARIEGGMLITPSGLDYDALAPADIVGLTLSGEPLAPDGRRPSTEWRMHARIYGARADVHAIVHTHSTYATALACLRRTIPPFHYMVAAAGGSNVPCTPYATFGTEDLAAYAVAALVDRNACLLANHGVLAVGHSLPAALALVGEVEVLARQYCVALCAGEPVLLTDSEMAAALEAFADYRRTES